MIFTSSNASDIERYYYQTWIKLPEFGDKLFFVQNVSSEMVTGTDDNGDYFELLLSDEAPYPVEYVLPHKAIFQWKERAVMLQRIPARQYRRGLSSGNTKVVDCSTGESISLTTNLLKAFVSKQRFSPFSAAFAAKSKMKSVALSPRMWFHRSLGRVCVDFTPVAQYDYETKRLTMLLPIFLPEIMQHMVDNNELYEVVV